MTGPEQPPERSATQSAIKSAGASRHSQEADRAARLPGTVTRRLFLAQLLMTVERLIPALWPPAAALGTILILALFGLFGLLPGWLHLSLVAGLAGAALVLTWQGVTRLRLPNRAEAARRLEEDGRVQERPLTLFADEPAVSKDDPVGAALWRAHRQRLKAALSRLRLRPHGTDLPSKDPFAVRAVLGLLLIAGLIGAGAALPERLSAIFKPGSLSARAPADIIAWIDPPAYTGEAPLFLAGQRSGGTAPDDIWVPEGSLLKVQIHGVSAAPTLRPGRGPEKDLEAQGPSSFAGELKLTRSQTVALSIPGNTRRQWRIDVAPDRAPLIALAGTPEPDDNDALTLMYEGEDDYGIVKTMLRLELNETGTDGRPVRFLGEPSEPLELQIAGDTTEEGLTRAAVPLADHPWAGHEVRLTLIAEDAAGQTGQSRTTVITLPERLFFEPLAKAVIDIRKRLAVSREPRALHALIEALTAGPQLFFDDTAVYLGLRTVQARLTNSGADPDLPALHELLWDIALKAEEGDLGEALRRVQLIRDELMQALAEGASAGEISRLMEELKAAVDRYVQLLAALGPEAAGGAGQNTRPLEDFLQSIEDLAGLGANQAAREMLAQLDDLLRNLQVSRGQGDGEPSEREQAINEAMGDLGELVGDQRRLLDDTFQSESNSRSGQPQSEATDPEGLAQRQEELQERLSELQDTLNELGLPGAEALEEAREQMQAAGDALDQGETGQAQGPQEDALDTLRSAAEDISRAARRQMAGQQGDGEDPLGRNEGGRGNSGGGVEVPDERDVERAREILEDLRRRASDRNRPAVERDYIERLLERF